MQHQPEEGPNHKVDGDGDVGAQLLKIHNHIDQLIENPVYGAPPAPKNEPTLDEIESEISDARAKAVERATSGDFKVKKSLVDSVETRHFLSGTIKTGLPCIISAGLFKSGYTSAIVHTCPAKEKGRAYYFTFSGSVYEAASDLERCGYHPLFERTSEMTCDKKFFFAERHFKVERWDQIRKRAKQQYANGTAAVIDLYKKFPGATSMRISETEWLDKAYCSGNRFNLPYIQVGDHYIGPILEVIEEFSLGSDLAVCEALALGQDISPEIQSPSSYIYLLDHEKVVVSDKKLEGYLDETWLDFRLSTVDDLINTLCFFP